MMPTSLVRIQGISVQKYLRPSWVLGTLYDWLAGLLTLILARTFYSLVHSLSSIHSCLGYSVYTSHGLSPSIDPIFVSLCRLSIVYHIQCVCIILVVLCYCFDVFLLQKKFKRKLLPLKCITVKIQYLFLQYCALCQY